MELLRRNWYDLGGLLAVVVLAYLFTSSSTLSNYKILMWLSLVSLFFHQLEEYRIVGTFPGMANSYLFNSKIPDRYPINVNTAFYVNVVFGWTFYFFAAVLGEKAIWFGMATILVSFGNVVAHTFVFNIKGKTLYNAGLATCWLLFVPCIYFFVSITTNNNLASPTDYWIGIPLGLLLNYIGIIKLINWLANKNTTYIFPARNLLPKDRNNP